ncbi:MAG: ParB/RepB/Spo0J family partition protein [Candidatus Sulfotelmatobacter sp.]
MSTQPSQISAEDSQLRDIPVAQIDRNPENPRLVFRSGEMEELLESIRRYGVQVPVSVYKEGRKYVLIDGERRWYCCQKLGKETIPALIQKKPTQLTNLLLMFNIHALREQWDLLTIAMKIPRVVSLLESDLRRRPTEREIADHTGLKRSVIRRSRLLSDLPKQYQEDMLDELKKPKAEQKLTEDFFIEMERALTTVERALPDVIDDRDRVRRVLISKYQSGVIDNRVHFRNVAKIARAERVSGSARVAKHALKKLFTANNYSIDEAFRDSVSEAYSERDIQTNARGLIGQLDSLSAASMNKPLRETLESLYRKLREVLKGN